MNEEERDRRRWRRRQDLFADQVEAKTHAQNIANELRNCEDLFSDWESAAKLCREIDNALIEGLEEKSDFDANLKEAVSLTGKLALSLKQLKTKAQKEEDVDDESVRDTALLGIEDAKDELGFLVKELKRLTRLSAKIAQKEKDDDERLRKGKEETTSEGDDEESDDEEDEEDDEDE